MNTCRKYTPRNKQAQACALVMAAPGIVAVAVLSAVSISTVILSLILRGLQ